MTPPAMEWERARSGLWVPDSHGGLALRTRAVFEVIRAADGVCVDGWETANIIVDDGKSVMLGQLFGQNVSGLQGGNNFAYPAPMNTLGVGTDSTAAAVTQSKLNPGVAGSTSLIAIASYTMGAATGGAGSATAVVSATWGTGVANFSWNEWGIFNGTTNGTSLMFDRSTFGAFNKTSAVSIVLTVTITQS